MLKSLPQEIKDMIFSYRDDHKMGVVSEFCSDYTIKQNKIRQSNRVVECGCGASIKQKSMNRHEKTGQHKSFEYDLRREGKYFWSSLNGGQLIKK